jgi:hypothetical protein
LELQQRCGHRQQQDRNRAPATRSDAFELLMCSDFTATAVTATMIGKPVAPYSAI